MTTSLDLINLLLQLTELRETFYLLDPQIYYKRIQFRGSQMEAMHKSGYREGCKASRPSWRLPVSRHLHVFTTPDVLQALSFWAFMKASLHRHG